MSKKNQKNPPQAKQAEIVEQQKDPMLRTLQKKVRNMNKKLNQIAQLSLKKDLKPEQEQKINKKEQVTQQRQKYQQMIQVYKQIAAESQKNCRKFQLAQLEDIAKTIACVQYGVDLGNAQNLAINKLVNTLSGPRCNQLTLYQRVEEITNVMFEVANNSKLKKAIKQYVQQNINKSKTNHQSLLSNNQKQTKKPQEIKKQVNVQSIENSQQIFKKVESFNQSESPSRSEKAKPQNQPASNTKKQAEECNQRIAYQKAPEIKIPEPLVCQKAPIAETKKTQEQGLKTQPETGKSQAIEAKQQNKEDQANLQVKGDEKDQKQQKGKYTGKGYQGAKPQNRNTTERYDDQKRYKKRTFKPKYQQAKQKKQHSSSQQSDDQPKARQFKRQQVKQLIEDGFIVVGKPKPKGRDQRQYHQHQHGNKQYHQPHSKKNY